MEISIPIKVCFSFCFLGGRAQRRLLGTVRGLTRLSSITLYSRDRGFYSQPAADYIPGPAPSLLSVACFSCSLLGNFWLWVKIDFWRSSPIRQRDETDVMEGDRDSIPTMTMPWVDDCDGRCAKQWGRFENYTVAMVAQHSECTGSY